MKSIAIAILMIVACLTVPKEAQARQLNEIDLKHCAEMANLYQTVARLKLKGHPAQELLGRLNDPNFPRNAAAVTRLAVSDVYTSKRFRNLKSMDDVYAESNQQCIELIAREPEPVYTPRPSNNQWRQQ